MSRSTLPSWMSMESQRQDDLSSDGQMGRGRGRTLPTWMRGPRPQQQQQDSEPSFNRDENNIAEIPNSSNSRKRGREDEDNIFVSYASNIGRNLSMATRKKRRRRRRITTTMADHDIDIVNTTVLAITRLAQRFMDHRENSLPTTTNNTGGFGASATTSRNSDGNDDGRPSSSRREEHSSGEGNVTTKAIDVLGDLLQSIMARSTTTMVATTASESDDEDFDHGSYGVMSRPPPLSYMNDVNNDDDDSRSYFGAANNNFDGPPPPPHRLGHGYDSFTTLSEQRQKQQLEEKLRTVETELICKEEHSEFLQWRLMKEEDRSHQLDEKLQIVERELMGEEEHSECLEWQLRKEQEHSHQVSSDLTSEKEYSRELATRLERAKQRLDAMTHQLHLAHKEKAATTNASNHNIGVSETNMTRPSDFSASSFDVDRNDSCSYSTVDKNSSDDGENLAPRVEDDDESSDLEWLLK